MDLVDDDPDAVSAASAATDASSAARVHGAGRVVRVAMRWTAGRPPARAVGEGPLQGAEIHARIGASAAPDDPSVRGGYERNGA